MKKFLMVVSLFAGLGLAGSALAQSSVQSSHPRYDRAWQGFLRTHPNVKRDMSSNPNALLDPTYRRQHPELAGFLQSHPHERSYLFSNGGAAVAPHSWMGFLQNHPNYQQSYYQNPYQFADPNWVSQHPDLQQYYASHPGVRDDLQDRGRYWQEHHDYDGWRWRNSWNDADEDEDRDEHWEHEQWEHHPPGHAYGWEKHHAHEEWEEHEAAEHHHWDHHGWDHHGHGHGHGHHDDD